MRWNSKFVLPKTVMFSKKTILLTILLAGIALQVQAQRFVTTNDFDKLSKVTVGFNINTYFGELRRVQDPKLQAGFGFGIGYEHLMTDNIALRTNLGVYTIKADDALSTIPARRTRNLNFKATNIEFSVQGMYYMFRHPQKGYAYRAFLNPYFHLGFGITTNNPKAELKNGPQAGTYDMRPLRIEGQQYSGMSVIVPLGIGFDIFVSREFDIQLDLQYTATFTGYLDDVNGVYRDQASFTDTNGVPAEALRQLSDPRTNLDPPIEAVPAGTPRGDGSNDGYFRVGFKVGYYLPKSLYGKSSIRCRVVKKTR